MSENGSQVFRKESLQRIQSPEQLTDYLKVTNPGIWIILIAVIVLLAGLFVWSTVGKLETVASGIAVVSNGEAQIYLAENAKGSIEEGMLIRFDKDTEYSVSSVEKDEYGRSRAHADVAVSDGTYDVTVVMESISPIRFLID